MRMQLFNNRVNFILIDTYVCIITPQNVQDIAVRWRDAVFTQDISNFFDQVFHIQLTLILTALQ